MEFEPDVLNTLRATRVKNSVLSVIVQRMHELISASRESASEIGVACEAGSRKGGKSKWAILPRPIFSRFTRSSFPFPMFPSPSYACNAAFYDQLHGHWLGACFALFLAHVLNRNSLIKWSSNAKKIKNTVNQIYIGKRIQPLKTWRLRLCLQKENVTTKRGIFNVQIEVDQEGMWKGINKILNTSLIFMYMTYKVVQ